MSRQNDLVFLPLGGSGEIGMNLNLYGYGAGQGRKWIMIDCGVMFGDARNPGVDVITPDPDYIVERKKNLLGMLLTHGHEDHIGAVAHLWPMLECPIFATAFTADLLRRKFEEKGVSAEITVIEESARFELGPFDLEYVTLTHSIPEPNGVVVRTPAGVVLHTGDWKIDIDPSLGPLTDAKTLTRLGDEGVLAMICDSTNVLSPGTSGSEMRVRDSLVELIGKLKGRVAVTTFASNVGRVLSICVAAKRADREVCLLGRSMLRIVEAAQATGVLPADMRFISPAEVGFLPRDKVLLLCTGSQGEPRAALSRIARDDHPDIALGEGDTVIFSSKIIPGNEREIFDLQNDLVELGVDIITEKDEFVHVSGHPCQDELRQMYEWVRPKFAVPVHGEARHLEAHAAFAVELGVEEALAPRNGDLIRLGPDGPEVIEEVPSGRLFLDGFVMEPEGAQSIRMRRKLAYGGVVTVSLALDDTGGRAAPVAVAMRGVPERGAEGVDVTAFLMDEIKLAIDDMPRPRRADDDRVEQAVRQAVRHILGRAWGKRTETVVHILRV